MVIYTYSSIYLHVHIFVAKKIHENSSKTLSAATGIVHFHGAKLFPLFS